MTNAVERRMSESRVRENLMHGLMREKRAKPSNLLYSLRCELDGTCVLGVLTKANGVQFGVLGSAICV